MNRIVGLQILVCASIPALVLACGGSGGTGGAGGTGGTTTVGPTTHASTNGSTSSTPSSTTGFGTTTGSVTTTTNSGTTSVTGSTGSTGSTSSASTTSSTSSTTSSTSSTSTTSSTSSTSSSSSSGSGGGGGGMNFDVVRIGDGATGLTSAAAPVFVEEHDLSGTMVGNPVAMPIAVSGNNRILTMSGSATAEGSLSRSADGHFVVLAGYDAAPATLTVGSTASATVNRTIGRVNAAGDVDTSTRINAGFDGGSIRSAASTDGSAFWAGGAAATASNTGGYWYTTLGATGGTQISLTPTSARATEIFGGQLYGSAASTTFHSVFTIGTNLPTTTGQTPTLLPGLPAATNSPYAFALVTKGAQTLLYIADDRSVASGGGVEKWTFDGTTWTLSQTFAVPPAITAGARGVTAAVSGNDVTVIAVTAEGSPNNIVLFDDDGGNAVVGTVIAAAGTNEIYRGVALAPQ